MANAEVEVGERTSLTNKQDTNYGAAAPSTIADSSTSGDVNHVQFCMLICWLFFGIVPDIAALSAGFDDSDIDCNHYKNAYLIRPKAYLKVSGLIGIFISIFGTLGFLYLLKYTELIESLINGKLSNISNTPLIIAKFVLFTIFLFLFIWFIIGWTVHSQMSQFNGCLDTTLAQTIIAWTVIQLILLICAISSRFAHAKYTQKHDNNNNDDNHNIHDSTLQNV